MSVKVVNVVDVVVSNTSTFNVSLSSSASGII